MIAKAVKVALYSGLAASLSVGAPAFAADDSEEGEKIVVTGSRIKRTDIEGATPVISITAEDMENAGRLTVADALRNATFNSFGSFNEQSGSSAQSQATISLLGAGANRTLVLLDGKRIPGSPTLGGTAVNLNTIPMAMVERIDVMKDAGSAVYGSDAIAGVINIITKKNFDGVNISAGIGRPNKEGADSEEFSIVAGASSDRGNITVAFDHQVVDAVFDKDRPYTAAALNDDNGDGTIQAYFETQGVSFYGATVYNPDTGLYQASPLCDSLTASVPGFVGVLGGDAVFGPGGHEICGYAYANISANKASINRNSVFVNGEYNVNDNLDFFTRMMFVHNRSFGRYAPPAAAFPFIPVGNPNNPSTQDTYGYFRWYQLGPRDNNVDDYAQDYLAGFRGTFGETAEWEVAYHYNQADFKSVGNTYLSFSGLYTNLYLNEPFDSEAGLGALGATTLQEDRNTMHQITAGVGFEAGELSGGPIAFYVGGELIEQRYQSLVDKQSEAGWVGGSAGNSSGRSRDIRAYYAEAAFPFMDNLEVNLAVRYDDYSDFGTETSPKVSVRYQPIDDLVIRASWGEGFRAPTLAELSAADAFSAESAIDYFNCFNNIGSTAADCPTQQFDTTVQSNANLGAETSDFINFGIVYNIMDNLTVRFDYADVSIDGAIGYVSVQDLVYMDLLGIDSPAGTVLCRALQGTEQLDTTGLCATSGSNGSSQGTGAIRDAFTNSLNGSALEIRNVDLELDYSLETSFGMWNFNWITSRILDFKNDVVFSGPLQDTVGFAGLPETRSQFTTVWSNEGHAVAWNMDYIASTAGAEDVEVLPNSVRLIPTGSTDSLLIHNLSYTYNSGDYGRYTIGARNVTDEGLPNTDGNAPVFDTNLYTPAHLGRTVYLNVSFDL